MHVAEEDISMIEKRAKWSHNDSSPITRLARYCYLQIGSYPTSILVVLEDDFFEDFGASEYGFECSSVRVGSWELHSGIYEVRKDSNLQKIRINFVLVISRNTHET